MKRGKNILLVDDEPAVRSATSLMLGLDGHRVTEAKSGAEALKLFEQEDFDLVITDFAMEDMNGSELVAQLKRLAPAKPVVMITGHEKRLGCLDNPVDAILTKPYRLGELRGIIERVLTHAEDKE
jgi:CheY-like chemotaxis protein